MQYQQHRAPSEESVYATFTTDDPKFRPLGKEEPSQSSLTRTMTHDQVQTMTHDQATRDACMPVECPLHLDLHIFNPVGPCMPTRAARKQANRYLSWISACLRGSQAGCSHIDALTYQLSLEHPSAELLGDNDDPNALVKPRQQMTLFPLPPIPPHFPDPVEETPHRTKTQAGLAAFTLADVGSIYQLPIPYAAEVPEKQLRRPLYFTIAGMQPGEPREHRTGYQPVRRIARFKF